jgi:hypothetical protein
MVFWQCSGGFNRREFKKKYTTDDTDFADFTLIFNRFCLKNQCYISVISG